MSENTTISSAIEQEMRTYENVVAEFIASKAICRDLRRAIEVIRDNFNGLRECVIVANNAITINNGIAINRAPPLQCSLETFEANVLVILDEYYKIRNSLNADNIAMAAGIARMRIAEILDNSVEYTILELRGIQLAINENGIRTNRIPLNSVLGSCVNSEMCRTYFATLYESIANFIELLSGEGDRNALIANFEMRLRDVESEYGRLMNHISSIRARLEDMLTASEHRELYLQFHAENLANMERLREIFPEMRFVHFVLKEAVKYHNQMVRHLSTILERL